MLKHNYHKLLPLLFLMATLAIEGQPLCQVTRYDEDNGVASSHITQLLQDRQGFMWFSTWNGLCRYDGYEFRTFKPQVGDGCHMTTDRIRDITLLPDGNILCNTDLDYYIFNRKTYRFRDLTDTERKQSATLRMKHRQSRSIRPDSGYTWTDTHKTIWTLHNNGRLTYRNSPDAPETEYPTTIHLGKQTFALADARGTLWVTDHTAIYKLNTGFQRTRRINIEPQAEVKCLFHDRDKNYWIATKQDQAVRIYRDADNQLLGYLGADGHLHQQYTSFGAAVYCIYQSADGTLWLGAKPQGLFRLRPTASGNYTIDHLTNLPNTAVYHLTEDRWGRLWVATLGGGVFYTSQQNAEEPLFLVPRHYPLSDASRARYIFINRNNIMMIATANGLLVTQLGADPLELKFRLHQREPDRRESLSCSATMDVVQDKKGRIFVSTESGGVCQIMTPDLLAPKLNFKHLREQLHEQPCDVVQSMTPTQRGGLLVVGSNLITLLDSTLQGRVLDASHFHSTYRYSEAHPLPLSGGRWIFGLTDGAFVTTVNPLSTPAYSPRLVLTSLTVQGSDSRWAIDDKDTLNLLPSERSMTLHFAAIDYQSPKRIGYSFQLLSDSQSDTAKWNYIGTNRSVTLLDLEPGTYHLVIRSTNADGEWQQNHRRLTIIVQPTFWESALGKLLILLLIAAILAGITYTLLYIRRIKRQQHETLEAYLELIEKAEEQARKKATEKSEHHIATDDPMMQRVMEFIEANISNSKANVGEMAMAAATSRSGLQRKLKQVMGITPQDLLREARIKRACQLLRQTDKTIAEVAYACGFSDPKYFSRSFKQSTGQSPTEYKLMV